MRLIDADWILRAIDHDLGCYEIEEMKQDNALYVEIRDVVRMVCAAPTLTLDDIVPHGWWVGYETDEAYGAYESKAWYKCSECGKDAYGRCDQDEWYSCPILSDYCPNCGAKMDLEINE